MSTARIVASASLFMALGSLLVACGYSTHLTVAIELGEIESIGVEIFGNDTLERDLERELHAELTRSVRNLIDADLVSPERADVVLRGKLTRFSRRGGIRSRDNELVQTGLLIAVEASLVELSSGESISGPLDVDVDVGFSLTGAGMEAESRRRALINLADRITLDLFTAGAIREPPSEAPDTSPTE